MEYIFIGGLYPKERLDEIRSQGDNSMGIAANVLQWSLLTGLDKYYPNIKVITVPYISTFPKKNKTIFFRKSLFSHKKGAKDFCVGFLNLPLIRIISRYFNLIKTLKSNIDINKETIIFIYGIHSPFLKATIKLAGRNALIKTCLIVTDIPQYNISGKKNSIYLFLKKLDLRIINQSIDKIDSFVLLSKYMCQPLNVKNRPWTLVEGIYNNNDDVETIKYKDNIKRILYSGSLAERYGILNLVEAFMKIESVNCKLIICGDGDCRSKIENYSLIDQRIIYKGLINREEVLKLQKKCDLLVNPRTPDGEYTKYSFPSKTMEYLASGTPTLLYRLPGIPDEYYEYCYSIYNAGDNSLYDKITEILEKPKDELKSFGLMAREFILKNKNPEKQCEKIVKMINKL